MSFRILDQAPQYLTFDGLVLAGGSMTFFENNTTIPKSTFSDPALTIPNANPLPLDASGATTADLWGDGVYTVVVKDALGATRYTRDDVQSPVGAGATIPALISGEFLTNDGVNLLWDAVRQVPDPSGQTNKILSNDGSNIIWIPQTVPPTPPAPLIQVTATSVSLDDGGTAPNKMLFQNGSGTCITAGGRTASTSVVFPVAYNAIPFLTVTVRGTSFSSFGNAPTVAVSALSATGFTVQFKLSELDDTQGGWNYNQNVPFDFMAMGIIP